MPLSGLNDYIPSLYSQVYANMYAATWAVFNDGIWRDVREQVGMITVAGIASSAAFLGVTSLMAAGLAATGVGALVAGAVFAVVYFLESTLLSAAKKRIQKEKESAQTYYRVDEERKNDLDLSEKSHGYEDAWEHIERHPSAKYVPVSGGEPGRRFTAQALAVPPKKLRLRVSELSKAEIELLMASIEPMASSKTDLWNKVIEAVEMLNKGRYTYTNLDFLLVSSELPSYNSKEHYQFSFGEENIRTGTYSEYPHNTLGYLDNEIEAVSNGLYDTIRPYNINGRPSYIFINSSDNQLTMPASALYQPVVISNERYNDLAGPGRKIPDGTISVDIKIGYLSDSATQGIDTTDLTYAEIKQGYKAKIPLFADEFKYPISKITMDVIAIKDSSEFILASGIEFNSQDYVIIGNTLYFFKAFDKSLLAVNNFLSIIMSVGGGVYDKLMSRINIDIPLVIPNIDAQVTYSTQQNEYSAIPSAYKLSVMERGPFGTSTENLVLDTTTSELARTALTQATSYLISDYFNVFTIAEQVARSQAEQDYTAKVTAISTFWSSLAMLPITVLTAGANAAITQASSTISRVLALTAAKYLAQLAFMVATEVFEELYIDTWIERQVTKLVKSLGGGDAAAEFWTSFACSFREVGMGAVSFALGGFRAPKIGPDLDIQQSLNQIVSDMSSQQSSSQLQQDQEALNAISEEIDRKLKQLQEKSSILSKMKTLLFKVGEIFMASHSFFAGSAGLFLTGFVGDIVTDFYFDTHLQKVRDKKNLKVLNQYKTQLGKISKILDLRIAATEDITRNPVPQTKNLNPSKITSQLKTTHVISSTDALIESMITKIKETSTKSSEIKAMSYIMTPGEEGSISFVSTSLNSLANAFEESAEVGEGDPVYIDINLVKHWIKDLTKETLIRDFGTEWITSKRFFTIENKLTFKGFLALIGVKKGFVLKFGEIALRPNMVFNGKKLVHNMLIEKVFEIVGYKNDPTSLAIQYATEEGTLKIEVDKEIFTTNNIQYILEKDALNDEQKEAFVDIIEKAAYTVNQQDITGFIELMKAKGSEDFVVKLKAHVDKMIHLIHSGQTGSNQILENARERFINIWMVSTKKNGEIILGRKIIENSNEWKYLKRQAETTFDEIVKNPWLNGNSRKKGLSLNKLKQSLYVTIIKELFDQNLPPNPKVSNRITKIRDLPLADKDIIIETMISGLDTIFEKGYNNKEGKPFDIYFQALLINNFHITTIRPDFNSHILMDFPIPSAVGYFDTGSFLEAKTSISLLAMNHISIVGQLSQSDLINLNENTNFRQIATEYNSEAVDKLLTGDIIYVKFDTDNSAFDGNGREWIFTSSEKGFIVYAIPSKNGNEFAADGRAGKNTRYISSKIGIDLLRNIFQSSVDKVGLNNLLKKTKVILNGPMFNDPNSNLKDLYNFGKQVLDDLSKRNGPDKRSGLSGYRKTTSISSWDKFSSSQNSKKAAFETLNKYIWKISGTENNFEDFILAAIELTTDDDLMKEAREHLSTEYGYGETDIDLDSILRGIIENGDKYYGPIYDKYGHAEYGTVLRGSIGTYFTSDEFFEEKGTHAIVFKIKDGIETHEVRKLQVVDGNPILKLSNDDIKNGYRIGVATKNKEGEFEFHENSVIAYNDRKTFGRFEFDLEANTIKDLGNDWYDNTDKWNFEKDSHGNNIGISMLNFLTTTYGGKSVLIDTRTDVTSQYLKFGLEYDYENRYFDDESWHIESEYNALSKIVPIKLYGVGKAKEIITREEFMEAVKYYLFYSDVLQVARSAKIPKEIRLTLNKLLGKLNTRHDISTGISSSRYPGSKLETGTTIEEFTDVINSILMTENDILDFFFETKRGVPSPTATLKQWIKFVRGRITNPNRIKSSNAEVENSLIWASEELDKLGTLDDGNGKEYYFSTEGAKNSELERGMRMLDVILNVIGDKTFRFLISHSIKYNGKNKQLKLGITNWGSAPHVSPFLSQFGFYPSEMISEGKHPPFIKDYNIQTSKISLYFGESLLYFPIRVNGEETRTHSNAYKLSFSPLSFLSDDTFLATSNIHRSIVKNLESEYSDYIEETSVEYSTMNSFLARSLVVYETTSSYFKQLRTQLNDMNSQAWKLAMTGTGQWDRFNAIRQAELYIRANMDSVRLTIENGIRSGDSIVKINIPIFPDLNLKLDILNTKADVFGTVNGINSPESILTINEKAIQDRIKIFKTAIQNRPGGAARFYIAADVKNYGLQYLSLTKEDDSLRRIFTDAIVGANNGIYFDVDIDDNQVLRQLAILSMSYINNGGEKAIVSLIMKDYGASMSDNALFILSGDKFLMDVYSHHIIHSSKFTRGYTNIEHDISGLFINSEDILTSIKNAKNAGNYIIFDIGHRSFQNQIFFNF
ncbi:hypothetical protein LCGC14_0496650 [marine sediment metagenome]|uniref:Uncharacterized protein n=1 Tax=marine sediment metagenome TaxID=412755 RepID=A0A0F9VDR2_9ZZZZ